MLEIAKIVELAKEHATPMYLLIWTNYSPEYRQ
mgnify:CR=1 FL=1